MPLIKIALIALAALAALALVVPALLPSRYRVARSIDIARPRTELARTVANLHDRTAWTPWVETEPTASYNYTGAPGALGSSMRFDGQQIGTATVTLESVSDDEVVTAIVFERPMRMTTRDAFALEALDATHTRVTWSSEGELPYPMGRVFGVLMDRLIGPDYERGLANLRRFAEDGTRTDASRLASLAPAT